MVAEAGCSWQARRPAIRYLDYQTPANNDWLVVNLLKFHDKAGNSIPDLVVYVNDLPLGVVECKASGVIKEPIGSTWSCKLSRKVSQSKADRNCSLPQ